MDGRRNKPVMLPRRSRLRATELARSAGPANARLNQIAVIGGRVVATGGSDGQVLYKPASGAFGAYGTVLIVPLDDLPDWLPAWCLDHLGGEPAGVLFQVQQISMVFGDLLPR